MYYLSFFLLLISTSLALANHGALRIDSFNQNPINSAGQTTASFATQLREHLDHELAQRLAAYSSGFVTREEACLHGTAAGLVSAAFSCEAYTPERISQTATAITYPAIANDVCWTILSSDDDGIVGWTRVGTTAYYVMCEGNSSPNQPDLPSNSVWLMQVTVTASAIASVTDLRKRYPEGADHIERFPTFVDAMDEYDDAGDPAVTLTLASFVHVTANTTCPDNVTLHILRGGALYTGTGVTLTLDCPVVAAHADAFQGPGTVLFQGLQEPMLDSYITQDCVPVVPGGGGLVLAAFACRGFVAQGAHLATVRQGASAVTVSAAAVNWIALTQDTTSTPAGCGAGTWTRVSGTHYATCANATQPAEPTGGHVIVKVTVAGGNVTAIESVATRIITTTETISVTQTWSGKTLFRPGGVVAIANGVTLSLNGPIDAGEHHIIDTSAGGVLRYDNQPHFSVRWTGADPTGTVDSTAAFNAATQAARPWDNPFEAASWAFCEVQASGGVYRLDGTVYIRPGQHLRGTGWGGTRINGTATPTNHLFKMGWGIPGGVETGDGIGTFPELSGFIIRGFGGGTSWAAVHPIYPGARISNMTFSSTSIGILAEGNDLIINNIQIDSTFLNGIVFRDINQATVSDIYIFTGNFGIRFGDNVNDVIINNLNSAYTEFAHVSVDDGATGIHNIRINNWSATMNLQHATFLGYLHSRAAEAEIHVNGFSFRNMKGPAVNVAAGFGTRLYLSSGIMDAARTHPLYTQSTTAAGIVASNAEVTLDNVEFRGLAGQAITMGSTGETHVIWTGGRSVASGVTPLILITNTNGDSSLTVGNLVGDDNNLYNAQSIVTVRHLGALHRWFPIPADSGVRLWIPLPYQRATIYEVAVRANVNVGGGGDYLKSAVYLVTKRNDFSGAVATSYLEMFELARDAVTDGAWPQLDVQAEFGAVGGTASIALSNSGLLVLTVPNTYVNLSFTVRQVASSP